MTPRPRVVVIGGGLAGLAAALRCADDGADVTVIEKANRLGGATWSFTRDGLTYDNGQHVFMRCCTDYLAFLHRIGSSDKVTLQPRLDVPVHAPGGPIAALRRTSLPSPLHLARSLMTYRHLRWSQRLAVVRASLALRRLDLLDPSLDEVTFGAWLERHGVAADALPALWDLVIRATVNLPSSQASLTLGAKVFRTGLLDSNDGADIGWATVPLQQLHGDAGQQALDAVGATVHLATRVDQLAVLDDSTYSITIGDRSIAADAVIVAVPHEAVAALVPPGTLADPAALEGLGRSPIINVHLLYDRPVIDAPFVAGVDSPVQFVFDRTDSAGAPLGHQAIAISLSTADEYLGWNKNELVEQFTVEMARLFPAAAHANVVSSMVTREVAATFRGAPGTARLRPGPVTATSGVFLAGAWTDTGWPATMEGAVRSGNAAADATHHYLTTRRRTTAAATSSVSAA